MPSLYQLAFFSLSLLWASLLAAGAAIDSRRAFDLDSTIHIAGDCSLQQTLFAQTFQFDDWTYPQLDGRQAKGSAPVPYTPDELKTLYGATISVANNIGKDDLALFLGNSASYFFEMIDNDSSNTRGFNARSIPISGSREFADLQTRPKLTVEMVERWFKTFLYPALTKKSFERVVLVDHSRSGRSVDGFKQLWEELGRLFPKEFEPFRKKEMVFLNVLDRRALTNMKITAPAEVRVLAQVIDYDGPEDRLNAMVGGVKHARLLPEYPYTKWKKAKKECWQAGEEVAANKLRKQINDYAKSKGGKITRNTVKAFNSNDKDKKVKKINVKDLPLLVRLTLW